MPDANGNPTPEESMREAQRLADEQVIKDGPNSGSLFGLFNTNQGAYDAALQRQNARSASSQSQSPDDIGVTKSEVNSGLFGIGRDTFNTYTANKNAWSDPNSAKRSGQIDQQLNGLATRGREQMQAANIGPAAQMQGANIDQSQQGQWRQQQMGLASALQAQANGTGGPSIAEMQLARSRDDSQAQALGMAASARGMSPAEASRQAMMNQAQIGQNAAGQAAELRANEQQAARQQLAGVLDQGRGADIGLATSQAGLTQGASQFNAAATNQNAATQAGLTQQAGTTNLGAQMQQQQGIDDLTQKYIAMGMSADDAAQKARVDYQKYAIGIGMSQQAAKFGQNNAGSQQAGQLIGAGLSAAGSMIGGAI